MEASTALIIFFLIVAIGVGYIYVEQPQLIEQFKSNNNPPPSPQLPVSNQSNNTPSTNNQPMFINTTTPTTTCENVRDEIMSNLGFIQYNILKTTCATYSGQFIESQTEVSCSFQTESVNCNSNDTIQIQNACKQKYNCNTTIIKCSC